MPDASFHRLHIAFIEDFLPIGMAMINRAKRKGVGKFFNELSSTSDTLETLRGEGIESAKYIRDKLDQIRPGLGNPALEVQVANNSEEYPENKEILDPSLTEILVRIEDRLASIQEKLDNNIDLK